MKKIRVEDAVGMVLCHDLTKVVPGEFKGRAFKKGHIIQQEDIPELLKIGKHHIYVWEAKPGEIHEDEAALRIAKAIAGEGLKFDMPYEGKCTLVSAEKGLFEVDSELLYKINCIPFVSVATLPGNFPVENSQEVTGCRVIPLVVDEQYVKQVEDLCGKFGPALKVSTYRKLKAGIVTTGNEVYQGLIKDKFGPVMKQKLQYFSAEILGQTFCPDDMGKIKDAILNFKDLSADLIIVTGGMSVDPDDLTSGAIKETGAHVITYGAPVQPGNMFMMAYLKGTAVFGVPACAMFMKTTILDAVLTKVFAGHELRKEDFIRMGEGGFCSKCEICHYPRCSFCG